MALVVTGVVTGLVAAGLMFFLYSVQHAAFHYHAGDLEHAVEHVSSSRRVVVLLVAGAIGGPLWFLVRRHHSNRPTELDDTIWRGDGNVAFVPSLASSMISEFVIGMGASIGREAAPRLMGGASASLIARWTHLSVHQQRLLVACGAGAGLGAVYNVPIGAAVLTAEVLYASSALPVVLPALACSWIATATSWIYLSDRATYVDVPAFHFRGALFVFALVAGPVIGCISCLYVRLIAFVSHHQLRGRVAIVGPIAAFGVLALVGIRYPQLFGNGKDIAHDALIGQGSMSLFFALFMLKPLVTALCLEGGAMGGLFTPTLSIGATLGAFGGSAWAHLFHGSPIGAYAMVGAVAMLGASMQAPLAALVLMIELTHAGFAIMVPISAATVLAVLVARHLDGYSIYSARLPALRNEVAPD